MKLEIYMKSGNVIAVRGVSDCEIGYKGNTITSLTIEYRKWFRPSRRLFMASVDLTQIEAIVKTGLF
jgi:hypothetical protein